MLKSHQERVREHVLGWDLGTNRISLCCVSSLRLYEQNQVVEEDTDVTGAHLPSPLQEKRHFQIPCLILLAIRWVSVLWKLIFHLGKENAISMERCLIFFFLISTFNIKKHFNWLTAKWTNVCFAHCYISQAQTTVRAPGYTSLVKWAGLSLGFSKLLKVGDGELGAHEGDPCIWVQWGIHES